MKHLGRTIFQMIGRGESGVVLKEFRDRLYSNERPWYCGVICVNTITRLHRRFRSGYDPWSSTTFRR